MDFNHIQTEIARQIHVQKPDALVPGKDVAMSPLPDGLTVEVQILKPIVPGMTAVMQLVRRVRVTYNEGADLYAMSIEENGDRREYDGVYCDMLGELIFGADAAPFTEPMITVITEDDDGQLHIEVI